MRPRVLLLDEPLSALDAQIRHNMVEEIARLHRELPELTILYVTHDQTEALTLADKIGIMKDGSLIAHGETHQLYHYPPNRFSAEFLGRANILQATALTDTAGPGLVSVSCGGGLIAAFSRGGQHGNNKLSRAAIGHQQPAERHPDLRALAGRLDPSAMRRGGGGGAYRDDPREPAAACGRQAGALF